jgi:hypothetical protein
VVFGAWQKDQNDECKQQQTFLKDMRISIYNGTLPVSFFCFITEQIQPYHREKCACVGAGVFLGWLRLERTGEGET